MESYVEVITRPFVLSQIPHEVWISEAKNWQITHLFALEKHTAT